MAELTPEEHNKQSEAYIKGLEADLSLSLEGVKISAQAFDRQIIYIAGGALALTIGFLKDILPLAPEGSLYVLLLAWLAFGLALLFNLMAHQASAEGYNERMALSMHYRVVHESTVPANEESNATKEQGHIDKTNSAGRDVNRLNKWQTRAIATGVFFTIIFAFLLFSNQHPTQAAKVQAPCLEQQKDSLKPVRGSLITSQLKHQ